jgi:hypothetical protein
MFEDFAIAVLAGAIAGIGWLLPSLPAHAEMVSKDSPSLNWQVAP